MSQCNLQITIEVTKRPFQAVRLQARVPDKSFHLYFAKIGATRSCKAASKPFDPCNTETNTGEIQEHALTFEHLDFDPFELPADALLFPLMVVVIPQDRDDRQLYMLEGLCKN